MFCSVCHIGGAAKLHGQRTWFGQITLREVVMKRKLLTFFAVVVGLPLVSVPMFAHHGTASYDTTKSTSVKGTVTDFQFANPHVQISLDVTDGKGKDKRWTAEALSPNMLSRQGWNRNTLKPGDKITIVGAPDKDGANALRLWKIVLSDGREFAVQGDY